jgi:hypothetical protein
MCIKTDRRMCSTCPFSNRMIRSMLTPWPSVIDRALMEGILINPIHTCHSVESVANGDRNTWGITNSGNVCVGSLKMYGKTYNTSDVISHPEIEPAFNAIIERNPEYNPNPYAAYND